MPILFSVIARGTIILVKHAVCPGNFVEVTEQVLPKIGSQDGKLTYSHGDYLLHYVCENSIVFMCITDDDFERSRAFAYLNEVKRRFQLIYGQRTQTALPYAMNSDFAGVLSSEMKAFSYGPSGVGASTSGVYGSTSNGRVDGWRTERLGNMQSEVEDLKQIMVRNIDSLTNRGEKLELLIDRSQNLEAGTVSFRTRSRNLARTMCWKNIKITACLLIIFLIVIFIIITSACGGLSYPKC